MLDVGCETGGFVSINFHLHCKYLRHEEPVGRTEIHFLNANFIFLWHVIPSFGMK